MNKVKNKLYRHNILIILYSNIFFVIYIFSSLP